MVENEELLNKLGLIAKLLYIRARPGIEELKIQLIKTKQQEKAYKVLNGKRTMKQIAKISSYSIKSLEKILPEWERKGLILSVGQSTNKKYVNIENLEI